MKFTRLEIPDVVLVEPRVFEDERGYFMEVWQAQKFAQAGIDVSFVQDNQSQSRKGTLRGLHYQIEHTQGKLIRAISGTIFDVAVDLRRSSPTFGRWVSAALSGENKAQLFVPAGFAHGFLVTSEAALIEYKCTDVYSPTHERTLAWDDPTVAVEWPLPDGERPALSPKDRLGVLLQEAEVFS